CAGPSLCCGSSESYSSLLCAVACCCAGILSTSASSSTESDCSSAIASGSGSNKSFTNSFAKFNGINCIIFESIKSPTVSWNDTFTNTSSSISSYTSSNLSMSSYSTTGGEISTRLLKTVDILVAEDPII